MATFKQQTGRSIKNAFRKFHQDNPEIYEEFRRLAFQAIRSGQKKISAKLILNVIRWYSNIRTAQKETLYGAGGEKLQIKLNDAYSAHYARLFAEDHPEHAQKFEFRRLRSAKDAKDLFDLVGI